MSDDRFIKVRRVAAFFYTWDLRAGGHQVIGFGTKGDARDALERFILKHGGRSLQ